jgi:hypothetical protein
MPTVSIQLTVDSIIADFKATILEQELTKSLRKCSLGAFKALMGSDPSTRYRLICENAEGLELDI